MPDLSLIIYHFILPLLEFFRHALGNYGWAIIVVTIVLKLLLLPLSVKQIIASRKMQTNMGKIKPELEKLKKKFEEKRKKYENKPEKLVEVQKEFQAEMVDLYRNNGGFNPLSGCLPLLAQFPILIALYWAFSSSPFQAAIMSLTLENTSKAPVSDYTRKAHSNTVNFVGPDGRVARFRIETDIPNDKKLQIGEDYSVAVKRVQGDSEIVVHDDDLFWRVSSVKDKKSLHPTKEYLLKEQIESEQASGWQKEIIDFNAGDDIYTRSLKPLKETEGDYLVQAVLINSRAQESFGFIQDLGHIGLYDKRTKEVHWDIVILLILLIGSFWMTTKMMSNSSPQMPSLDPNQEKMQKQMQNLMPLMFSGIFIFLPLPAAVFLYFLVSNLIQVAQTKLIEKFVPQEV